MGALGRCCGGGVGGEESGRLKGANCDGANRQPFFRLERGGGEQGGEGSGEIHGSGEEIENERENRRELKPKRISELRS